MMFFDDLTEFLYLGEDVLLVIDELELISDSVIYYIDKLPVLLSVVFWIIAGNMILRNMPYWLRLMGFMISAWFGSQHLEEYNCIQKDTWA